jgi:hypothetical protein
MVTKSASALTIRRSILGQLGMLLLVIVALGSFSAYLMQPLRGGAGAGQSASRASASAIQPSSGQDMLSVAWLEQQRTTKAAASSSTRSQDDVLSLEWLEQHRQSSPNEANVGSRAAPSIPHNYIGFIE